MPALTARTRSHHLDSGSEDQQMIQREEKPPSSAIQTRFHPYAREHIIQGNLDKRTAYQISANGQKTHPDWKFRGPSHGDIGLQSSDTVLFWVPPYILMAFSDKLRERIQSETRSLGAAVIESRQSEANNASRSRQSAASAERRKDIVFDFHTTHHRVLAMFLSFTKGDHNAIEIYTASQYRQCVSFARTYRTKHFLTLLTEKVLPKVIDLDPMGTWAYACETDDNELAKQCFVLMGDHWCISVESSSRIASWSVFSTGVYSTDTPVQCADAFSLQIGFAKFRAFLSACDSALKWAGMHGKALDEQPQEEAAVSSTRMLVESETNYIVVEGKELWNRIYSDTMANAAFNIAGNEIVDWADDIEEFAPQAASRDHVAPGFDGHDRERLNNEVNISSNSSSPREVRVLADESTDISSFRRTESAAMISPAISPQLVCQFGTHDVSPRQHVHSPGSLSANDNDSPARYPANGDMTHGLVPNAHAQDQYNFDESQAFVGDGSHGFRKDMMARNDAESDDAMEDDPAEATAV